VLVLPLIIVYIFISITILSLNIQIVWIDEDGMRFLDPVKLSLIWPVIVILAILASMTGYKIYTRRN
jgi:hypothetical protein